MSTEHAPARRPVASGLHAALLFARGRREALAYLESDMAGARRSFLAIGFCLPAFVALRLIDWRDGGMPPDALHAAALDLIGFVVGWAGFALATRPIAAALGRADRWPRYIAAWNWCNVAQYALLLLAALPELAGAPATVQQATGLIALGWALWLEWYATRLALDTTPLAAAALVALDLALGIVIAGIGA